jgi:hypothetical protein
MRDVREGRNTAMDGRSVQRQLNRRSVGLLGIVVLPLVVGALQGMMQALIVLCVLAFLLAPD